jgi:carboxypeptidase C (cathepsin A)
MHYGSSARRACAFTLLAALVVGNPLRTLAQQEPAASASALPIPKEREARTQGVVHVDGRALTYDTIAGNLLLRDDKDQPTASVFYVAYTVPGAHAKRPITFLYNGGPGSSSVWLHMGSVGPRRVATVDGHTTPPAPYDIVENAQTLLDRSDLVFVDAVGTGFSTLAGKGEGKSFWGVDQDASAFAQFVRRFVTKYDRWNSPKFLFGESYGTTRSANLVNVLQNEGMAFNGVVLVSTVLNFGTLGSSGPSDDLSYELFLPTEAAVAWYHDAIPNKPSDLGAFVADVRRFATGEYAAALARGASLDATTRASIAERLHGYLGLSSHFIALNDLRVSPERFEKELLRDRNLTVGRLDGRYLGYDLDAAADSPEYDPTDVAISGPFTAAFNRYVRDDLHWVPDGEYKPTNYGVVNRGWQFSRAGRDAGSLNVAGDLAEAMTKNPALHVFSANGYFDLATPFYATEFTLAHLGLDPSLDRNITYGFYPSGHMIYLNAPSLAALKRDLSAFYASAARDR